MKKVIKVTRQTPSLIEIKKDGDYVFQLIEPQVSVFIQAGWRLGRQERRRLQITIQHLVPQTKARVVLRGVVDQQSRLFFQGKIRIEKNCSQTQSFLDEKILVLDQRARAEAVPELEILANDVYCSHAAVVTHISPLDLFYLRQRRLSIDQAKRLFVEGFLQDGLIADEKKLLTI